MRDHRFPVLFQQKLIRSRLYLYAKFLYVRYESIRDAESD